MSAELVVVKGDQRGAFVKVSGTVTIGRSEEADIALTSDGKVSHVHARVSPIGGDRFLLEDLGSTNGTFVNDERVEQVPLRSGDLIKVGRSLIVFRTDASNVQLEDIALLGGGSSAGIARRSEKEAAAEKAATSSHALPPPEAARPEESGLLREAFQELILASGEVGLRRGLERSLQLVVKTLGAGRAHLFLRHPLTGGLLSAAVATPEGVPRRERPVDPELLSRAMAGEVVAVEGGAAAAPVRILGLLAGAIYVDGCRGKPRHLAVLTAAGVLTGLQVGLDRSRRLAASASEIVALAQAPVQKRPADVRAAIQAVDRLYANVARQRGLVWELASGPPRHVLADPVLLGRGLDKLIEHVLGEAQGKIRIGVELEGSLVRVLVRLGSREPGEGSSAIRVDPLGVAADLRRAGEAFGDGTLAVARVALLRAGARFTVQPDGGEMVFSLELEQAAPTEEGRPTGRPV